MTVYVGVDPGETTGFVITREANPFVILQAFDLEKCTPFLVGLHLRGILRDVSRNTIVICEQSVAYGSQFPSELRHNIRIEGAIYFVCHDLGILVYFRNPDARTSYQWLADYRMRTFKKVLHGRDALAHVLAYLHETPTTEEVQWKLAHSVLIK